MQNVQWKLVLSLVRDPIHKVADYGEINSPSGDPTLQVVIKQREPASASVCRRHNDAIQGATAMQISSHAMISLRTEGFASSGRPS